jgi:hypothetical protein
MSNTPKADEAYEAGQQANFDGALANQNPYRFDAYKARRWQQGWEHAQLIRDEWADLCDQAAA